MTDEPRIFALTDDLDRHEALLAAAEPVHRQLRPALPADYVRFMRQVFAGGAEMAALLAGERIATVAVYRCHPTTAHGHRFYIDDLVTDEADRGRGFGRRMLDWCEERARARGCASLDLESGVQRQSAHRFYFREGFVIASFGFRKALR
jgi:GNAT superfamily N-acetyltransferase